MPGSAEETLSSDQSSTSYLREKRGRRISEGETAISEENSGDVDTLSYREGPPPLNYTLHTPYRERYIAIFFTLLFVESGVLPLILFYALRWGAHLSVTVNLAIITSVIGTFTGFRFSQRLWWLWFSFGCHERRPIGSGRWSVDSFQ